MVQTCPKVGGAFSGPKLVIHLVVNLIINLVFHLVCQSWWSLYWSNVGDSFGGLFGGQFYHDIGEPFGVPMSYYVVPTEVRNTVYESKLYQPIRELHVYQLIDQLA